MKLEDELREAYQGETSTWATPPEGKENMLKAIRSESKGKNRPRKWLVATVIAAVLIIPTGAYAGYTYLADDIYGAEENIRVMGGTSADYNRLEAKLQEAKAYFSEVEFTQYMGLLKQWGQMSLTHADSQGEMHPEQWSTADQEKYNQLVASLESFFERLEGASEEKELMDRQQFRTETYKAAEEMLSKEEFIEFQVLFENMEKYEAIVVDENGSIHEERLSAEQKQDLDQVRKQFYSYLDQIGYSVR
ncbi:DUF3600 domain-containing protein [Paenibacillus sp. ACRSA]|uniref:DUF3600 domain-containing protein n=1 Tax=Paenibacillus sp. ACRSA TaxID=2918211 RepID=UPI001EF477EA|nr:DUF3600 domain-containing protein [Paenibacillus sp. ACRSA]MCG7380025.1 DUF3600 domain-containing protein [Paenibacillus sp. ACRSA]